MVYWTVVTLLHRPFVEVCLAPVFPPDFDHSVSFCALSPAPSAGRSGGRRGGAGDVWKARFCGVTGRVVRHSAGVPPARAAPRLLHSSYQHSWIMAAAVQARTDVLVAACVCMGQPHLYPEAGAIPHLAAFRLTSQLMTAARQYSEMRSKD